jgi:hypothetical protein
MFNDGPCSSDEFYRCDFEKGLCGIKYENSPSVRYNWTRTSGRISTTTGPTVDHTVILFSLNN